MEGCSGLRGHEKIAYELTLDQRLQLEGFFERCPHPDETEGNQIAKELGLELKLIHHWFQNKRTKALTLVETSLVNQEYDIKCDPDHVSSDSEMQEEKRLAKVANLAMAELLKLASANQPLWSKSSYTAGSVLVPGIYANMFPRVHSLNTPHTLEESSKFYRVVRVRARQLVDMLLDSEEWVNYFPTIVSKSETVKVLDVGSLDNRNGALQVVCEEMEGLSPLVSPRELLFLRYCHQVRDGVWAIAHVSIDSIEGRVHDSPVRRLPSGCIIYQMTQESSMVIWVEHVEVNDSMATSSLVIRNNLAYGAERWLWALNRMCERFVWTPIQNKGQEVVKGFSARMRAMRLSNRMVNGFFGDVYKVRDEGLAKSLKKNEINEIKISLRSNTTQGIPEGTIATAITCMRLPVPPQKVCTLLMETKNRSKWDVLSCGWPVDEISQFTMCGRNRISILKTNNRIESDVMMFQDCYVDPRGAYLVYAPISMENVSMIMNGADSMVSILPSGFLISEDSDHPAVAESSDRVPNANNGQGSSLLTMAFQLLLCSSNAPIEDQNKDAVARIVVSTLQNIKTFLNVSDD